MRIDVENIAKLRIAVARYGEMDRSKWWNTKGMLGHVGELAVSRGFPKSHVFARARAVFAVAASRSDEVFNPPDSYTLWRLPVEIEDQVEDAWAKWLEDPDPWKAFLADVDSRYSGKLLTMLGDLELISGNVAGQASKLRRADDLRSVPIKVGNDSASELIALLAAAHNSSESGKLAVPFIREEEFPK